MEPVPRVVRLGAMNDAGTARATSTRPATGGRGTDTFEDFYRRSADGLRRALCLALGDVDLGAEACDEAMARVCTHWAEVGRYANPEGWAYRVGVNWGRSRLRRRRWRDLRPVPDRPAPTVPDDHDLTVALARLSVTHRTVVVCRYLLDWSVEETATALDIPIGTVKSRLSRALHALAAHLEATS